MSPSIGGRFQIAVSTARRWFIRRSGRPRLGALAFAALLAVGAIEPAFSGVAQAAPSNLSFQPTFGPVGTTVTIHGKELTNGAVSFNGTSASVLSSSAKEIKAVVPVGATSGPITVTTSLGVSTSKTDFLVGTRPVISSFSPTAGPVGQSVRIDGSGLTGATVAFNGTAASVQSDTDTEIVTSVPAGATTGPISVTTAIGSTRSSTGFTVSSSAPIVSSITPAHGGVAQSVTISGSNLSAAAVAFGGVSATVQSDTATQIVTSVPLGARTGPIRVTTPSGATDGPTFTVDPPNIVLILTDDQRYDQIANMPTVQSELVDKGMSFSNSFVVNPLCCPSRATILTGQYSHGTKVYDNTPPYGGYQTFTQRGDENSTIATWLHADGYYTGLVGKYLNGYTPKLAATIPPGWDQWDALAYGNGPAGEGANLYYNYYLDVNGTLNFHGTTPADYSTDVLSSYATSFIDNAPSNQPLFLYFAPRAPHLAARVPQRYKGTFPNASVPRAPSFNEADVSDKPAYIQNLPQLTDTQIANGDAQWRRQLGSLLAVDDSVKAILQSLQNTGRLNNTLIVYASDNGLQFGEHRWTGKRVPYEESIRVPLIVRYDPVTNQVPSTSSALALNLDYAPTFAAAAGVSSPGAEGASLLPLLSGSTPPTWRTDFLIEHEDTSNVTVPTYCAVRSEQYLYVEYQTGEQELYDLNADPFELQNLASDPAYASVLDTMHQRMLQLCVPPPPGFTP